MGIARRFGSIVAAVWRGYWRDECILLAAAISFYAIFSIIPFLLLLFVVWGAFIGSSDVVYGQIVQFATELMPEISPSVLEDIRSVVEHRSALGWVGILFLLWVFDVVFYAVAHALDRIFGSGRRRRYYKTKLYSFAALLFGVFILYVSIHLAMIVTALRALSETVVGHTLSPYLAQGISFPVLVYLLLIGIVTAVFRVVPQRDIRLRYALLGGLLCVNLWYVAKIGYGWYMEHIAVFNIVYGALGALLVVVLWIFYSANILLISAEWVAHMQNHWETATNG